MDQTHACGDLTYDDRTWSTVAHILGFFTSIFGPLVIWIVKRSRSRFVAFHSLQAVLFQIAVAAVMLIANDMLFPFIGHLFAGLFGFVDLVVCAYAALPSLNG